MGQVAKHAGSLLRLCLALSLPFIASGQPSSSEKKISVGIIYEALTATNAPIWLAEDLSLYGKYGLDVKVIHARGAAPRPGFRELVDLSILKIPFLQGAIEVRRELLQSRRLVVLNFLRAYLDSIKIAKERPELAVATVANRLRVTTEVARAGYPPHARVLEEVPYVRADSVQAIVELFAADRTVAARLIDNSALKELVDSGFVKELNQK